MTDDEEEIRERFAEFDRENAESTERWIEQLQLDEQQAEAFRNHGKHWILIDGEPVSVGLLEWGRWFGEHVEQRIIARDEVVSAGGRIFRVSTVFLGLDHGFGIGGPPLLFETMIFDDPRLNKRLDRYRERFKGLLARDPDAEPEPTIRYDGWQARYATLAEAQAGHARTIQMVKDGKDDWDE